MSNNPLVYGSTGRRQFVGGLTRGAPSSSAPNSRGPMAGGVIVFPLCQKRAESGGGLVEDQLAAPMDVRMYFALGRQQVAGAGTSVRIRQNGTNATPDLSATGTAAQNCVTNEGSAKGEAGVTGFQWLTNQSPDPRVVPRGTAIELFVAGATTPAAFKYGEHLVCAVRGHVYDPDNTTADYLYTSTKD